MIVLMLSYFDVRIGPRVFLKGPEDFEEEGIELIPILMHLYESGYFVHVFGEYHSANLIFEIPSVSLRGNQERLLLTILNTGGSIDPQFSREFLEEFRKRSTTSLHPKKFSQDLKRRVVETTIHIKNLEMCFF